jgi:hypothetical protein
MVLVCAVLASLAAGILVAYGVCLGMFAAFRMHARQASVKTAAPIATTASGVAGTATVAGG